MGRKKLIRFEYNKQSSNVLEPDKELYTSIKGKWRDVFFGNANPVILELACGRGEYTVGLAQHFPQSNFIGIDRKGDRLASGSIKASELGLTNVAFLRTDIVFLDNFFGEGEVDEIWITFPDPQFRIKQKKNRLTHPKYLSLYWHILTHKGMLHLKTDNEEFFNFSLESLKKNLFIDFKVTYDLYTSDLNQLHREIETKYERIFYEKGFSIKYLQCKKAAR